MVGTVGRIAPPHRAGTVLDLISIESCCCMATITALKSAMLLLLCCTVALLAMLNAEKPLQIVSKLSSLFTSITFFA